LDRVASVANSLSSFLHYASTSRSLLMRSQLTQSEDPETFPYCEFVAALAPGGDKERALATNDRKKVLSACKALYPFISFPLATALIADGTDTN